MAYNTFVCGYMCVCVHVRVRVCVSVCVTYIRTYVYVYAPVGICVCNNMLLSVCLSVCAHPPFRMYGWKVGSLSWPTFRRQLRPSLPTNSYTSSSSSCSKVEGGHWSLHQVGHWQQWDWGVYVCTYVECRVWHSTSVFDECVCTRTYVRM